MIIRHAGHDANFRAHLHEHLCQLGLGEEAAVGLELAGLIKMLANLYDTVAFPEARRDSVSWARWGVLFALMARERHEAESTLTPTFLSHILHVSKNTVSSLLRGLEEQGLIARTLDPVDRRLFHIQLTPAGRELIASTLPQRIRHLNELSSGLAADEQEQLLHLLEKLRISLMSQVQPCRPDWSPGADEDSHGKA
jgi:DNA-binding MarR family transcriptional regulator